MRMLCIAVGFVFSATVFARPQGSPYTEPSGREQINAERAQAVIDAFRTSWDGYYKYAFPHDELHPVTNRYSDSR